VPQPVVIAEYDPAWVTKFEEERMLLEGVFSETAVIEHIGSTAVPGLASKPIIDIMVGVSHLEEAEARVSDLARLEYQYVPEYERLIPERRYFRKPRNGAREYHLHCVLSGGDFWKRYVVFRDYLRAQPEAAMAYAILKKELAAVSANDRDRYTNGKGPFIRAILSKAGIIEGSLGFE
jgi:GrpB-like predicted nucleotidyltransferase (UPF0157 family)